MITLNYDVVVEQALRKLNVPISYQLSGAGVEFDPSAGINEGAEQHATVIAEEQSTWLRRKGPQ